MQSIENKNVIVFDMLKKGDANKLRSWWDAHTEFYHFVKRMDYPYNKYYQLIRQNQPRSKKS